MENDMFADLLSGLQPAAATAPTRDDIISMEESRRKALSDTDEVPVARSDSPVGDNLRPPPPPLTKEEMQTLIHDNVRELLCQNFGTLTNALRGVLVGMTEKLKSVEAMCKETDEKQEGFWEQQRKENEAIAERLVKMEAALKESSVGIQRMLEKQDLVDAHVLLSRHRQEEEKEKTSEKNEKRVMVEKEPEEEEDPPTMMKRPGKPVADGKLPEKIDDQRQPPKYTPSPAVTSVLPQSAVIQPTIPQPSAADSLQLPQRMQPSMPLPGLPPQQQPPPGPPIQPVQLPPQPPQPTPPIQPIPQPEYQPPPGSQSFGHPYKPPYTYQPENGYQPPIEKPMPPPQQQMPSPPHGHLPSHPHQAGFPSPYTAPPPPHGTPPPPPHLQHPPPHYAGYPTPGPPPFRPPHTFRPQQRAPAAHNKSEISRGTLSDRSEPTRTSPQSVPLDQVINDVANMGFDRTKVRSVVTQLLDHGESVDLNVVIDRLTNMGY